MIKGCRGGRGSLVASLLLSLALLAMSFGAVASERVERYRVRRWQMDDGLPQNSVTAITQTRDGYLWIGTLEGLVRFDGVRFSPLDDKAPSELRHGPISALCVRRNGSLCIGSKDSGLWCFDGASFTHLAETNGLLSNRIQCLLEGSDGALWIGTEQGLNRYKHGRFKTFTVKNRLSHNSVRALCENDQCCVLAATAHGLSVLSDDSVIPPRSLDLHKTTNSLKGVCVDRKGRTWVTSSAGIASLDRKFPKLISATEGLPDPITTAAFVDSTGRLWVGTYNGVACATDGKVTACPMNEANLGDLVNIVFEDREHNLWIGARDGLYRINPAQFIAYDAQDGLSCDNVMAVLEDKTGSMWFATWGGGLNEFRDGKFTVYNMTNGLTHDKVLSLHEGRDGSLWAGTDLGGGLNRFFGDKTNSFSNPIGIFDKALRVIFEDRQGNLWIGKSGGLSVISEGKISSHDIEQSVAGRTVLALREDHHGRIWIGTENGLGCHSQGTFTNFGKAHGLSDNTIHAIYEDNEGSLWLGTRRGLNRLRTGRFRSYGLREGLFSEEILEILEDDFGFLWMSCRKGIFRVPKADFDAVDCGLRRSLTCVVFGRSDGLPTVQCNGVAKPSGWKSHDGRLWFPTIHGVVAVRPDFRINENPPPVVIEEVMVDHRCVLEPQPLSLARPAFAGNVASADNGKPKAEGTLDSLKVSAAHGELEIHYTALSFQAPEKVRFKYKLEGVDPDWVDGGSRRKVFYTNVAPGSHVFRVIACNNDGLWNETGAAIGLECLPHYSQSTWFKLFQFAGMSLGLGLFVSFAAYHKGQRSQRARIAADLHDDVGSRLTKVAMITELLDGRTPDYDVNKSQIRTIASTTGELIRAMDEIVWKVNPSNDTLDNLASHLFRYTQEYFQDTKIRCRLDFPANLPKVAIPTRKRYNLFMTLKEVLNNVLKHSRATEVKVGLTVEEGELVIRICDNGRGFEVGEPYVRGEGLRNMKERLAQIGGTVQVQTGKGQGTEVTMRVTSG